VAGAEHVGGRHAIVLAIKQAFKKKQSNIRHDLRWPAFDGAAHNNQPKTRGHDGAGLIEEVQPGGSAQGG
jgi:hypothetical protein